MWREIGSSDRACFYFWRRLCQVDITTPAMVSWTELYPEPNEQNPGSESSESLPQKLKYRHTERLVLQPNPERESALLCFPVWVLYGASIGQPGDVANMWDGPVTGHESPASRLLFPGKREYALDVPRCPPVDALGRPPSPTHSIGSWSIM